MKKLYYKIRGFFTRMLHGKWITVKVLDGYWVDDEGRPIGHVAYLIQSNSRRPELRMNMEGMNPEGHITYVTALKVLARANSMLHGITIPDVYDDGTQYMTKIDKLVNSLEEELTQYVNDQEFEVASDVKYYLDGIKQMLDTQKKSKLKHHLNYPTTRK